MADTRLTEVMEVMVGGIPVTYRIVTSRRASRMYLRAGPRGIEVIRPETTSRRQVDDFIAGHHQWLRAQAVRIRTLPVPRLTDADDGIISYRGELLRVRVIEERVPRGKPSVTIRDGAVHIATCDKTSQSAAKSLERWLRRRAREELGLEVTEFAGRFGARPGRIYVMDQQTKWGNCSNRGNLSFSWRLIMAPPFVLRYLAAHEVLHLVIPDHSPRFWLTLQSHCENVEQARQWLVANAAALLLTRLEATCSGAPPRAA